MEFGPFRGSRTEEVDHSSDSLRCILVEPCEKGDFMKGWGNMRIEPLFFMSSDYGVLFIGSVMTCGDLVCRNIQYD